MNKRTLAKVLDRREPDDPRMYGVEFEVERGAVLNVPGWSPTNDGSLRDNGVEYIFNGPATYKDAIERVQLLGVMLEEHASEKRFVHSTRTSVHVHANATDFTIDHFKRLARIYTIVETEAFRRWGVGRDSTPYCVPLSDSDRYLHGILTTDRLSSLLSRYSGRVSKYSAFSLCRASDLGTVEFRLFSGTNDTQVILEYLEFVHMLMCGTMGGDGVLDVVNNIVERFQFNIDQEEAYLQLSVMVMLESVPPSILPRDHSRMNSLKAARGWRRFMLLNAEAGMPVPHMPRNVRSSRLVPPLQRGSAGPAPEWVEMDRARTATEFTTTTLPPRPAARQVAPEDSDPTLRSIERAIIRDARVVFNTHGQIGPEYVEHLHGTTGIQRGRLRAIIDSYVLPEARTE